MNIKLSEDIPFLANKYAVTWAYVNDRGELI
jgi:hypothetical protein